jgi:ferredoxin
LRTAVVAALCLAALTATGRAQRQPPPQQFATDYQRPEPTTPPPDATAWEYLDVGLLAAALIAASFLALKVRRRGWLLGLMLLCLAYFGFWRGGCVCAIGAIQNVALGLADSSYAVPLTVLAFLLLPLVFALLFGRVFCAAVCPLGAIQDAVLLRPVRVPRWLEHALGLGVYVYLGLAVLLAATGSAFPICRHDPFVGIFRLGGSLQMIIAGACLLLIAAFVGRPYCRFLCPLAALFRPLSVVSRRHVTITPSECVQCRLCEDACPFGAIRAPTAPSAPGARTRGLGTLAALLGLLPVLTAAGAWAGGRLGPTLAGLNPRVALARTIGRQEQARRFADRANPLPLRDGPRLWDIAARSGTRRLLCRNVEHGTTRWQRDLPADAPPGGALAAIEGDRLWLLLGRRDPNGGLLMRFGADTGELLWRRRIPPESDATEAFRRSPAFRTAGRPEEELYEDLYQQAAAIRAQFVWGGGLLGAFLGLVVSLKLLSLAVRRTRTGYEPDRAACLSCGRCFRYCPVEHDRRTRSADPPERAQDGGDG